MTDGMKSGAGSDPFAVESNNEESTSDEHDTTTPDSKAEVESESKPGVDSESSPDNTEATTGTGKNEEALPYIFQRTGVKDDRRMIQYFLREETEEIETDVQRAIEKELGTEVYLTDIREALVRVGAEHLDEVTDELREWGYRFNED
jgi:hypothetical protein